MSRDDAIAGIDWIEQLAANSASQRAPFVAKVSGAEVNGRVPVIRLGATTPEYVSRLPGYKVSTNDWVACIYIGHEPLMLGFIQRTAPTLLELNERLDVKVTSDDALRIGTSGGTIYIIGDTSGTSGLRIGQGARARFYSDNYATQTAEIRGDTGAATFQSVNTPKVYKNDAAYAAGSRPTNSSTSTYAQAAQANISLPTGNWDLEMTGGVCVYCAGSVDIDVRANIGGESGTVRTSDIVVDDMVTIPASVTIAAKPSGSWSARMEYKPAATGTVYLASAWWTIIASRVS